MKRRILSILCVLALCLGLLPPVTASAAAPSTLTVGGTTITSSGYWTTNADGTLTAEMASADNYNVYYDGDGTLTLKDATINGTNTIGHVGAGIYAEGNLTIVLEGSSTVTGVQDPNGDSQSIRVSENLTIQGGGSLTAQGAETSSGSSYGIFVIGSFTQQGGSVTASGGNVSGNYNSTGLYVYGSTVTVQGGTLKATGGATDSGSYGISMFSSVTVGNATVTATGGTGKYSYGLYIDSSSPSVTLSDNGSLTARSESADKAGGIYFQNPFGSAGSVTVGDNSTLLANSVILYDNSFEAKPLAPTGDGSWLIYGQNDQPSAVGGTYTLEENITIPSGAVVTIPAGSTLNLGGHTLTVDGTLNIANQSSLAGEGTLAGDSGTFNLTNPDPVISGSETLTYDGTDQFGAFKLEAPSGSVQVMEKDFTISDSPSLDGWNLETKVIKDAGTYTLTAKNGTTTIVKEVTVNPAEISITGATLTPKTYDGNTTATVESVDFTGLVEGDSLTSGTDYTATATFADKNVGNSKSATVTVTLADTVKNYTLASDDTTATGTISPLPVVLEWETTSFTYDGNLKAVTAEVSNAVDGDTFTLTYEGNTGTAVGNYTAKVTGLGNDNYTLTGATGVTQVWSIGVASIADATVELSETEFTYTGQSHTPTVTVKLNGNVLNAETDYNVDFGGDSINAGTYTVTVTGKGNYADTASSQPTYTIQAATPTLTWEPASQTMTYTGLQAAITAPTVALVNSETYTGGFTYQYKAEGDESYTDGLPTDAGSYTVKASVEAQGNYTAATSGEMTLTIQKADAVVDSAPSAVDGLTYTGKAQALVTAGKATGGTMQYSLSETGTYSTTIPTSTNVGSYTVWYKVVGDENHNDTTAQSVTATIAKAAAKVTKVPAANTLTYNGEAQALVTAGKADGGTLVYSLEKDGDYDAAIPTGTNAGSYTVFYYVKGDANHSDTQPVKVEVTIAQATPAYTVPTGLTATYGDTLADVDLAEGWSWNTPDASVGNVGGNTFAATFTPTDTANYNTVTENLTVAVSARDISGATITLGDNLTYTGQEQTQQIASVTVGGLTVTYTVTGNTGTDAGDYTLTVTGTGNYTGTATKEWTIAKANYNGTTDVSGTVLANWPDKVTLPDIPAGASYGAASYDGSDGAVKDLSIEGGVLSYTGGESITVDQAYKITVPVDGGKNYEDYTITVTLTGSDKQTLTITGVTAQDGTYNGQTQTGYTGTPSAEGYDGGFTVAYNTADGEAPTNAGAYIVTIAIPEDNAQYVGSADLQFTIAPKALTVSAPSPSVYVGDSAPELALTYTGLVAGESVTPSEDPVFTITKADGTVIALEDAVKTAGTYTITWSNADQGFTGDENYDIQTETAGTLTVSTRSSGGGSSSNITTETTKNPDGSTTITVTNKVTGTVTETTKFPDGSKEVVETTKDGTVTTTTTDTAGNKTEVVENTDGSSQTTVTNKDGSGSVTVVDENGNVVSSATLSQSAVEAAQEKGEAVTLPMPEVPVTADRETAPTVTVSLPSGTTAKVEIPVADVTPGTVAILVNDDGTEEVIKTSLTTENGVAVTLSDGDTVKVVDNSKTFDDVADNYWGAEAVDFAVSRELFAGTSATTFAPDTAMTRAMIVTVLARFEGVDTTTGSTWYEAGQQWAMENGVSDGTNMDASLTREQLATMLYRYAQSKGYDTTQGGMAIREYADFEQISDYAVEAMTWAVNTGLISGTSTTTLSPQGLATRAQVATILMRFIEGMA